ncbi:MAG: hypothetical protein ACR2NA_01455 [Solirubrobacterales bacterium]
MDHETRPRRVRAGLSILIAVILGAATGTAILGGWLVVGSALQLAVQGEGPLAMLALAVTIIGAATTYLYVIAWAGSVLSSPADTAAGGPQGRGPRHDTPPPAFTHPLERAFVVASLVAGMALTIWIFFLGGFDVIGL